MSTLKEISKNLKRMGAKKEDVKIALAIFVQLRALDRMVFPENPATINFSIRKHRFEYSVAHHPNKNTKTRYSIYLDGIADFLKEEKTEKCFWIAENRKGRRFLRPTWEELIVPIVVHEVRHRVQCDCSIKKFSHRSANLVKDERLKSIIEFNELVFEENRKTYIRENKSKVFIRNRINRKEFDASTIERLVANMIHRKNVYSLREEIVSTIKLQAP